MTNKKVFVYFVFCLFCFLFILFLFFLLVLLRKLAVAVVRALVCAGGHEELRALCVVVLSRVVERRAALAIAAIRVRARCQQRGDQALVALLSRRVQRGPEARRCVAVAAVEGHLGGGVDGRAGREQLLDDSLIALGNCEGQRRLLGPRCAAVHIARLVQHGLDGLLSAAWQVLPDKLVDGDHEGRVAAVVRLAVGHAGCQEFLHRLHAALVRGRVQGRLVVARVHGIDVGAATLHQRLNEERLVELGSAEESRVCHVARQRCQSVTQSVHVASVHDGRHLHWQVTEAAVAGGRVVVGVHFDLEDACARRFVRLERIENGLIQESSSAR